MRTRQWRANQLGMAAVSGVTASLAIVLALPGSAAAYTALDVLQGSVSTRDQIDYSATATVTRCPPGQSPVVLTQVILCQRGGKERVQTRGPGGNLVALRVCDGETLWEYHVPKKRVVQRPAPSPGSRRDRDLEGLKILSGNFAVSYLGTETVAGRPAYSIQVSRPRNSAPLRRFWIDTQTYLELKSERYGDGGRLATSVELTRVNYSPQFEPGTFTFESPAGATVEAASDGVRFRGPLGQAEQNAGFRARLPGSVPKGFALLRTSVAVREYEGAPVLWLRYTNGLEAFSIFQRTSANLPVSEDEGGPIKQWVSGGFHFTLVGRLSPADANLIAGSYR